VCFHLCLGLGIGFRYVPSAGYIFRLLCLASWANLRANSLNASRAEAHFEIWIREENVRHWIFRAGRKVCKQRCKFLQAFPQPQQKRKSCLHLHYYQDPVTTNRADILESRGTLGLTYTYRACCTLCTDVYFRNRSPADYLIYLAIKLQSRPKDAKPREMHA